jgi:hypothetical protein
MQSPIIDLLVKQIPNYYNNKEERDLTKLLVQIFTILALIVTALWIAKSYSNVVDYIIAVVFPAPYIIGRILDESRKVE